MASRKPVSKRKNANGMKIGDVVRIEKGFTVPERIVGNLGEIISIGQFSCRIKTYDELRDREVIFNIAKHKFTRLPRKFFAELYD